MLSLARRGEHRHAIVRWTARDRYCKNGDKRARGRINAGIVHAATILLFSVAVASLSGYLAMPALAGLLIVTAWLMSEPTRWAERMRLRASDRALFFMTMILTVASNLTIAIAVGTFAGLALRLLRKEVEPEEWTPADRSKL